MARRRSAAPAPPPPKPAREYDGCGTWDEVATLSSTLATTTREHERELWRTRASGAGVEVSEYASRRPGAAQGTYVLLARRPPDAPQDWRWTIGRVLDGRAAACEPPVALQDWTTREDATVRQLCDALSVAARCASATNYTAARLAWEYAIALSCYADEDCAASTAALAILAAWPLGDRGAADVWMRAGLRGRV